MSGIATAVVAGAVISSTMAKKSAKDAAEAQERANNTALGEQRRQFDLTSDNLQAASQKNRQDLQIGQQDAFRELRAGQALQQEQLQPFAQAGTDALSQQRALLGMGTPEQQQAAFNSFTESPGQKFIRDRAQKNLLRNSAAIGGLGGGNVRSALVEQGAGFAAQDFNNQFNRLSDLRMSGQNAATNIGQGALTTGGNLASTAFNAKQLAGAGTINTAARQGQFGQNMATNVGNLAVASGEARATGIQNQNAANQQMIGQLANAAGQYFGSSSSTPQTTGN